LSAPSEWPEPDSAAGGPLGDGRFALASYRPRDAAELCQIVRDQVAQGHAIYPQGGKTSLDYGGIPRRPGVAINTTALDQVIDYPHADMTITFQAGMTLSRLGQVLAQQGQRLLIDAPFADRATLGGIYATNTTGSRRFGAGRPRDQIIGVSFVTSEGVVVKGGGRVVKNVAGYDFPKLLTGSMGTLGIITQITVKVRPLPEASAIAWVPFAHISGVSEALDQLNTSGTRPIAIDLLNRPAAAQIGQPLGLPVADGCLVVGYEDNAHSVRWQIDRLTSELADRDFGVVEGSQASSLWEELTEFQARQIGPISFVANVRPSLAMPFVEKLDPRSWSVQALAGNGIIRAHAVGDLTIEAAESQIRLHRDNARQSGGDLILSRCPTPWKEQLNVWGSGRQDWPIAERVKAALDPPGAMNPGRFIGTI
jgi:glycolate oxidase FAD binding subunit